MPVAAAATIDFEGARPEPREHALSPRTLRYWLNVALTGAILVCLFTGIFPLYACFIVGENTGFAISPVVPSAYLALALAGVELRKHIAFTFFWAWGIKPGDAGLCRGDRCRAGMMLRSQ